MGKFNIHSNDEAVRRAETEAWQRSLNKPLTVMDKLHFLCDDCTTMNDWEVNFIESINNQKHLSYKQSKIVERIYNDRIDQ